MAQSDTRTLSIFMAFRLLPFCDRNHVNTLDTPCTFVANLEFAVAGALHMPIYKLIRLCVITHLFLGLQTVALAQNPGPCANMNGNWTDNFGYHWNVDRNWSTPSGVTGTGTFDDSAYYPGCPVVTRTVTGTYNAENGTFSLTAANPIPAYSPYCNIAASIVYSGSIISSGCNSGSGNWSNGSQSGSFTWTKPCDVPDGYPKGTLPTELSFTEGWADDMAYPTGAYFSAQLQADRDFGGRMVQERGGLTTDSCTFTGSQYAAYTLDNTQFPLDGSLGYNLYGPDVIGLFPQAVTYYRDRARTPCTAAVPQYMSILCNSGGSQQYKTSQIGISIGSTTIYVQRDNPSGSYNPSETRIW